MATMKVLKAFKHDLENREIGKEYDFVLKYDSAIQGTLIWDSINDEVLRIESIEYTPDDGFYFKTTKQDVYVRTGYHHLIPSVEL